MKANIFIILIISVLSGINAFAQHGTVYDNLTVKSNILSGERKFAIYLPPDYDRSQRSYPVLYLLHGSGDDQTGWVQFGEVLRIADEEILSGRATAMVIVMPDANTGRRGYINDPKGDWNYEDFIFEELMPHVEQAYRIKAEKRYRAISGLSMGGGGTFIYALHHPELFSSACPLSASAGPLDLQEAANWLSRRSEQAYSENQIKSYFERNSALHLIKTMPEEKLKSINWYIDCGDDDFLYEGNSLIHIEMKKRQIPHEYRVRDGAHNWTYWRQSLPDVLGFVSQTFRQH
ncbi:MAG: esterase family protein [Cyclobacteriaceae bacterium]|nr:esterase family protein [Cyclobacteriaceae bacterium]